MQAEPAEASSHDGDIRNDVERLNEFKHLRVMQAHESANGVGSRSHQYIYLRQAKGSAKVRFARKCFCAVDKCREINRRFENRSVSGS